jgi:transcriptional regulator with GAF, ATPase, and Fis domain
VQIDVGAVLQNIVRAGSAEAVAGVLCDALGASRSVILVRVWLADARRAPTLCGSAGTPSGGGNYSRIDGEFREMAIREATIAEIARSRAPFVVTGFRGDEEWLTNPSWAARQGVRTFGAWPLLDDDAVVGVLALFTRTALSSDVLAHVQLIADVGAARIGSLASPVLTRADLRRVERENIQTALAQTGGKVFGAEGAAALLGMRPTTLASRIKALGIVR